MQITDPLTQATINRLERELVQARTDSRRFESAYLDMRNARDMLMEDLRICCPPMSPDAMSGEVTLRLKGMDAKRVKVWSERGKILRIDMLPDDPIREEAERLAALPTMQGVPTEAIERVLREVRK